MILLNPGPVTLSARVRAALGREDLCHREPEFAALTLALGEGLLAIYPESVADYAAVLLTGSGSCAVEAMLSTFAAPERPTLVICNGVYGERMAQMLGRQRKALRQLDLGWQSPLDLEPIVAALDAEPQIAAVAVVHHETTTGRLNVLDGLARLCRERGLDLLIDAVSSFGAEPIDFAAWQPTAVAATANKCLHGIPGAAFVVARRECLQEGRGYATSLYLDLEGYCPAQRAGWSPFTQSVQAFQALHEALCEHREEGGWRARRARYLHLSNTLAEHLRARGVTPLLEEGASAAMLRAYRLPEGLDYPRLHDALKARGFVIYAGQGRLAEQIFRIATMGAIGDDDLQRLLQALDENLV